MLHSFENKSSREKVRNLDFSVLELILCWLKIWVFFRRMNEDFKDEANEVKMGCMELVITKASSGCRWHHDPRLHSGNSSNF